MPPMAQTTYNTDSLPVMSHRLRLLHGGPGVTGQVQLETASRGDARKIYIIIIHSPYVFQCEPIPQSFDLFIAARSPLSHSPFRF